MSDLIRFRKHNCMCGAPCGRELESEIEQIHHVADQREARIEDLEKQRDQAAAAMQRVRDRHHKITHTRGDGVIESFCGECLDYPHYPCPTIKDLDARETMTPEKKCPICGPSCTGWPHRGAKPEKEPK